MTPGRGTVPVVAAAARIFRNLGPGEAVERDAHIETIHGSLMAGNATPAF